MWHSIISRQVIALFLLHSLLPACGTTSYLEWSNLSTTSGKTVTTKSSTKARWKIQVRGFLVSGEDSYFANEIFSDSSGLIWANTGRKLIGVEASDGTVNRSFSLPHPFLLTSFYETNEELVFGVYLDSPNYFGFYAVNKSSWKGQLYRRGIPFIAPLQGSSDTSLEQLLTPASYYSRGIVTNVTFERGQKRLEGLDQKQRVWSYGSHGLFHSQLTTTPREILMGVAFLPTSIITVGFRVRSFALTGRDGEAVLYVKSFEQKTGKILWSRDLEKIATTRKLLADCSQYSCWSLKGSDKTIMAEVFSKGDRIIIQRTDARARFSKSFAIEATSGKSVFTRSGGRIINIGTGNIFLEVSAVDERKLKLFDHNGRDKKSFKLQQTPRAVADLDENRIVFAVQNKQEQTRLDLVVLDYENNKEVTKLLLPNGASPYCYGNHLLLGNTSTELGFWQLGFYNPRIQFRGPLNLERHFRNSQFVSKVLVFDVADGEKVFSADFIGPKPASYVVKTLLSGQNKDVISILMGDGTLWGFRIPQKRNAASQPTL